MTQAIRAIVIGATGRMGSRIIHILKETPSMALYRAIERPDHPLLGQDAGEIVGLGRLGVALEGELSRDGGDVVIDFTTPQISLESLAFAKEKGLAAVIGTTGFNQAQMDRIRESSKSIRCVLAPNMSVGVNLMFKIVQEVARVLGPEYDVEILEAHHRMKKDAPSGTAMKMAQVLAEAVNRNLDEVGVYARKGMIGERSKKEIGIQTLRAGDIVGDHTVMFAGKGERIEITHRAHSRDTFAAGAVRAAKWVVGKKPGLYDMQDVLGLK